ncbi:MAG: Gfo/Idh/MocA family oxidoreductase [Verrucomicrobia bacterium]|nr:Gfo/Idh/MocA family oxidoreductase [Verrucomicrobiota bacterium]
MNNWTRKDFLKASLTAGGAALLTRNRAFAIGQAGKSANGDIRVAVAGVGGQGSGHVRTYFDMPGTRLVAVCDADEAAIRKNVQAAAAKNIKVKSYQDFRKLLEDKEVDAIVGAPPNHWHSLMTIWALQAGKDVYMEKPLSHNIWEGRQAVEATKKYSKNVAVSGTQNRSSHDIVAAIEYIKSGKLGKIQWARGLCYKTRDSIGKLTEPQKVPDSINYDLWTGPADLTPSRRNGPRGGPIHYDWHWFWNYGGGDISNQGIHQVDVARWILGEQGLPKSVLSFGGRFGYEDAAETPNTLVSVYHYEKAPMIFEVRGLPMKAGMRAMDRYRQAQVGVIVQCEGGYVHIGENGSGAIYDNDNKKIETLAKGGIGDHRKNFVKAMQERKVVHGLISEAHTSVALCHLGNISYLVGAEKANAQIAEAVKSHEVTKEVFARTIDHLKANNVDVTTTKTVLGAHLQFDGAKEMFVGKDKTIVDAANKSPLRKRVGRAPFIVPDLQKAT